MTALVWHSNAASCCLVTVRWEGNRKWSEMCWGDQQERQEVCFLWGEPRRKLSFSSVLICFLALRLSCFQNLWNWFREKWLSLTKESFYLPVQWFFPSVLSWLVVLVVFPRIVKTQKHKQLLSVEALFSPLFTRSRLSLSLSLCLPLCTVGGRQRKPHAWAVFKRWDERQKEIL